MIKNYNLVPKLIILLLFGFFLNVNCSTEEAPIQSDPIDSTPKPDPEPEPVVYFTFSADDTYSSSTDFEDNWVILYDSNGNLLDHKPYESEDILEFKALEKDLTDKITVTLFSYRERTIGYDGTMSCDGSVTNIVSYPEIPKGSSWLRSRYSSRLTADSFPNRLGEFDLTIENIPIPSAIPGEYPILNNFNNNLEDANSGNLSSLWVPEFGGGGRTYYSPGYAHVEKRENRNFENTTYLMSLLHSNEGLKYLLFQNPEEGNNLTIDYGDFQPFDSYSYFPVIPESEHSSLQLVGYEDETSFKTHVGYFCLEVRDIVNQQLPLGFLDRFTHYKTFCDINYGDSLYNYYLLGPKPNITSLPDKPSVSFTQDGINGFDFNTNTNYVRRTDNFGDQEPVSADHCHITLWQIECNDNNYPVLTALPDELYTMYPGMAPFDQLKYESSEIHLQGKEYSEFLRNAFDPTYDHILKFGDVGESFTIYR
nr:hypothetical protein [Allomuricauda sp.]